MFSCNSYGKLFAFGKEDKQLRMTELWAELDKWVLDKSGLKAALVKCLERSILETSLRKPEK